MSGYTPLFDTMLTGTLYGRWPHTGIWACLLSRASREGRIDETPAALAAAIGVPVETLNECIKDFMAPDPDSRTMEHEGRRMALIDERRSWGWVILNHGKYREKARKKNYDTSRTESGADANRKRAERASRDVPARPDASRDVPLSEAEANNKKDTPAVAGLDLVAWSRWESYRREIRKPLKPASVPAAQRKLAAFGSDQSAVVENSIANGWTGLFALDAKQRRQGGDRGFVC